MLKLTNIISEKKILIPRYIEQRREYMKKKWLDKSDEDIVLYIRNNPEKIEDVPEYRFDSEIIASILMTHPSLINYFERYLDKVIREHITFVLIKHLSLINYFEKYLNKLSAGDIASIILDHPSLINYFEKYLDKLDKYDILRILLNQPSLISYLEIDKLSDTQISYILSYQPSLKKYFEKDKLKLENILSEEKILIPRHIEQRREYVRKNWLDKSDDDVVIFIIKNPEKIGDIPESRFNSNIIKVLLFEYPSLIDYFEKHLDKLTGLNIGYILFHYPYLINYFEKYLNKLDQWDILYVLQKQPSLIKYFEKNLNKLNNNSRISFLLQVHPQLTRYFEKK